MDEKSRIEKLMQAENLNSAQFAMETGIQTSTLSHILNGRNKVSLEVLRKILNRFQNISSDWLILGMGSMYRQEKHPHALTLFDFQEKSNSESEPFNEKYIKENVSSENTNQINTTTYSSFNKEPVIIEKNPRKITRIIVYFDDNSYQEFTTE